MTADRTCDLEPFLSPVTAQIGSLEQAGSALEILTGSLESYLARLKLAVCDDLQQIVDECCGGGPGDLSFLDLTDTPASYAGAAGQAVVVNNTEDGLVFQPLPSGGGDQLEDWISYFFGLVAGNPLVTIGNGAGSSSPNPSSTAPALTTASISASIYKVQFVTANSTNQICWVINTTLLVTIGPSSSIGGFRWRARSGPNSAIANQRCYFGLRAVTTNPTSVNPSAQTNIIGFGCDAGETTLNVLHNDGVGTATKVALGANFPMAAGELYDFSLECEPGTGVVSYRIRRLNTGDEASGTINTDLPSTSTFLTGTNWCATSSTAGIASLWFANQYISRY